MLDIRDHFPAKERGIGVLITDHNVRETSICDRATINLSEVLASGRPGGTIHNQSVQGLSGEHFWM